MDAVDRDILRAEMDATSPPISPLLNSRPHLRRNSSEIERVSTHSSSSYSVQSRPGGNERPSSGLSRITTQNSVATGMDVTSVALSRIHTARSQHSATVGRSLRSRTSSTRSRPLPAFGAGKSYPPALPDQEEYVVEFDGPDDPLHAQNWPIQKK